MSTAAPRTILFGTDARTVFGYTGDPTGKFGQELRIIAYGAGPPAASRFVSVKFGNDGSKPQIDDSGASCVKCHYGGYLWAGYRQWAGTFAPNSDGYFEPEDKQGYSDYGNFLKAQKDSPRYTRIITPILANAKAQSTDGELDFSYKDWRKDSSLHDTFAPPDSDNLLQEAAYLHGSNLYARLKRSPAFPLFKYLLAASFLSCKLDPDIEKELNDFLRKTVGNKPNWARYRNSNPPTKGDYSDDSTAGPGYFPLRLSLLGEALGVQDQEWVMDLNLRLGHPSRISYTSSGALGPEYNLGGYREMRDRVFHAMVPDLIDAGSSLAAVFRKPAWVNDDYDARFAQVLDVPTKTSYLKGQYGTDFSAECKALSPFVRAEYARRKASKDLGRMCLVNNDPVAGSLGNGIDGANQVAAAVKQAAPFARCLTCHGSGRAQFSASEDAPTIPFDDSAKFRAWLGGTYQEGGQSYSGKTLLLHRLTETKDMPPGAGMSDDDRAQLAEDIKALR